MIFYITLSVVFLLFLLNYLIKWIKSYMVLSKIPGPPHVNVIMGNLLYFDGSPDVIFHLLRDLARNFYPIYRIYALHKAAISLVSPEDAELILSNPIHNKKGIIYNLLHNWLKDGLLTSFRAKWQSRRKILTSAFHFNILQQFVCVFNEEADRFVDGLRQETFKDSQVDVTTHLSEFTLKTITETAMGTKLDFHTKENTDYKQAVCDMGEIMLYRILNPWCVYRLGNFFSKMYFKEKRLVKIMHHFTQKLIKAREENFNVFDLLPTEEHYVYKGKGRLAMLDLLLQAKQKENLIDTAGIHEEVDTFTFEGHDTTAVASGYLLMLIACHSDVQNLVVEEMKEVLGDLHRKPSYSDLQNMKYMERCIKEALRLYPSVPLIARTLGEDLVSNSGYLLPKETDVVVHIYDIHHNPNIYPDPEKFDPDRFLPENSQGRHPFAYLPFSAGPRNCIGQKFALLELKALLCAVLSNFVLEPMDTPQSIKLIVDIVLRCKDGIRIKFHSR